MKMLKNNWFWPLVGGGVAFGLAAAKSRRGYTPLIIAGVAAYGMNILMRRGVTIDTRFTGKDFI